MYYLELIQGQYDTSVNLVLFHFSSIGLYIEYIRSYETLMHEGEDIFKPLA